MKKLETYDCIWPGTSSIYANHEIKVMKKIKMMCLCFFMVFSVIAGLASVRVAEAAALGFTTEPMVAAGSHHSIALRSDGTVWAWGSNTNRLLNTTGLAPVQLEGLTDIIAVSAGRSHMVALRNDGTVLTWGSNQHGRLGDGTTIDSSSPVQVQNLYNIVAISASTAHTVALRNDGTVWAWGINGFSGALGDGTNVDSSTPVQVQNLLNIIAISAGHSRTFALRNDGTVWACA